MKTKAPTGKSFEFYFPDVDTSLLVEPADDRVLFRATKNTFSLQRKLNFIHQLAAEGFIPDQYQWWTGINSDCSTVRWEVDCSWLESPAATVLKTRQFMVGLLAAALLLWLGLMLTLLLGWL